MRSGPSHRKRRRVDKPADESACALDNDVMFLVLAELGARERHNVSLVSHAVGSIFNHNLAWKKRFERHFPHRTAIRDESGHTNYLADYKRAEQEEYTGVAERTLTIIYAIKERDHQAIHKLQLSFEDLLDGDANNCSVMEWGVKIQYQPILDIFYRVICQHYLAIGNGQTIDAELVDEHGYTRLHRAVLCCQSVEHIADLIQFGGYDVNAVTHGGHTLLMMAVTLGRFAIVKLLIDCGANVGTLDADGYSVMQYATNDNSAALLGLLAAANVDLNYSPENNGQTALWHAARDGRAASVDALLKLKASPAITFEEQTPLYMAAANGHTECVAILLSQHGETLDYVNLEDETALFAAARNGHVDCVRRLMCAGADYRTYNSSGDTALLIAARNGHEKVIRALTNYGADIDQVIDSEEGMTALMMAVVESDVAMTILLLNYDADPNFINPVSGLTAFHLAIIMGCLETISAMMEANANPEIEAVMTKYQLLRLLRGEGDAFLEYKIAEIEQSDRPMYSLSAYELAIYLGRYDEMNCIREYLHPNLYSYR